jgi:trypsin
METLFYTGYLIPSRKASTNIYGGNIADIRNFPYQVAILQSTRLWCGGSILTEKWLLSAAHCVYRARAPLTVRAGSSFWSKDGSLHQVEYQNIYGKYRYEDVSVMRVTEPFVLDETRKPIP